MSEPGRNLYLTPHDGRCSGHGCVRCVEEWVKRQVEDKLGKKDLDEFELNEPGNLRQHKRPTPQADRIMYLVDEWFEEFSKKSSDYQTSTGNVSENFGLMGQYMKLTDKIHKLRKPMWDLEAIEEVRKNSPQELKTEIPLSEDVFNFEGTEEILRDIIGHCFLALDFIEQRNNK